jgi:type II secretory pathway predicted ATPase ExeA/phage tail protein X
MFLDYYGLREQPFGVTPDPRYLYLSSSHREALSSLFYAIETNRGFSALIAEPGMGKTSLLFKVLDSFKTSARTAFLFQTDCTPYEFLGSLLHDLGISAKTDDLPKMREALNNALLTEMQAGRRFVVVIDEAQNLDERVLESVRLLSNFETADAKLMHIVLAGQPQLADKLARPELIQLRQRVSTVVHLTPFSLKETIAYITHRMRVAGYSGPPLFTRESVEMVFRFSQGIPRNINNLCFQALTIGFGTQRKKIDGGILREVLADLELTPRASEPNRETQIPPPELPQLFFGGFSEPEPKPEGTRSGSGLAFFAFLAIPLLLIVLFTDPGLALEETIRGMVSNDGPATAVPVPSSLQLPRPPALAMEKPVAVDSEVKQVTALPNDSDSNATLEPTDSHEDEATDDQASGSSLVRARGRQNLFDIAREYFGQSNWAIIEKIRELNPGIGEPDEIIRKGKLIRIPGEHPRPVLFAANRGGPITAAPAAALPSNEVELQYPQTTFEIAQKYYGKWTWSIVEQIRSLNPRIHEPSDPIPAGTRILLPDRPTLHSSERGPTSSENPQ